MPRNVFDLKSGGNNSYAVPHPEKWGGTRPPPPSPTDRRPCGGVWGCMECIGVYAGVLGVWNVWSIWGCMGCMGCMGL